MAQQLWQAPSASGFDKILAGQTKKYTAPSTTMVLPNQDFSFEFLFSNLNASHVGTFAAIYRCLTPEATDGTNLEPIGVVQVTADNTGRTAFIRDVYGLVTRNLVVVVQPTADVDFRLSVVGVPVNG